MQKPPDWKLITDLPIHSLKAAIEKLDWYSLRWKIEMFPKILKSGCKAEDSKLRTADRLVNFISVFCILSWRIFWMTMINRSAPHAPPLHPTKCPRFTFVPGDGEQVSRRNGRLGRARFSTSGAT